MGDSLDTTSSNLGLGMGWTVTVTVGADAHVAPLLFKCDESWNGSDRLVTSGPCGVLAA